MLRFPPIEDRFTDEGELISEETGSINNKGPTVNTPPDKFLSPMPAFEVLYTVPVEFIPRYVRNKGEAALLFEVSKQGAFLDILFKYLVVELQQGELLESSWRSVWLSTDPYSSALIPLLGKTIETHTHNLEMLRNEISNVLIRLHKMQSELQHYLEVNRGVVIEFKRAKCEQAAQDKLILAAVEELLVLRLDSLFKGSPYSSHSKTWDSVIGSFPPLKHNTQSDVQIIHSSATQSSQQFSPNQKQKKNSQSIQSSQKEQPEKSNTNSEEGVHSSYNECTGNSINLPEVLKEPSTQTKDSDVAEKPSMPSSKKRAASDEEEQPLKKKCSSRPSSQHSDSESDSESWHIDFQKFGEEQHLPSSIIALDASPPSPILVAGDLKHITQEQQDKDTPNDTELKETDHSKQS